MDLQHEMVGMAIRKTKGIFGLTKWEYAPLFHRPDMHEEDCTDPECQGAISKGEVIASGYFQNLVTRRAAKITGEMLVARAMKLRSERLGG